MTNLNLDECRRLFELDGKRTPGDWIADDLCEKDGECRRIGTYDGTKAYYHRTATIAYAQWSEDDDESPGTPDISQPMMNRNARFMAAAPSAYKQLRLAVERIAELEKEVRSYQIALRIE